MKKKILSLVISLMFLLLFANITVFAGDISSGQVEGAISWAYDRKSAGDTSYSYYCLKFVADAWWSQGVSNSGYGYATEAGNAMITNTDSDPPRGAVVFWDWYGTVDGVYKNWGHVGISLGDGNVIHADYNGIKVTGLYIDASRTYRGWGAWGGHNLPKPIPPTVDEFYVSGATGSGFTVSANLGGGISSVWLNIYGPSSDNGYRVSASSGKFSHYIKYSDYGGYGKYSVHLYAENSSGEQVAKGLNNIYPSANLGNSFYAVIGHVKSWKPIGVDSDNFVRLGTEDGSAKYVWKFTKHSNGTYTIKSALNGKVLDVEGMLNENGAKLQVYEDQGNSNQRFMPLEQNGGYVIYPQHTLTQVLDLDGGQTSDGAKIQIWDRHDGENQIFSIWKGDNVQLKGATLTVKPGTSATSTVFDWNNVYGCRWFDLKIWNGTYWVGDAYHLGWGAKQPYSIKLPAGHYEAYVDSTNAIEQKMSNVVKFDVAEDSSDINIFSRRTVTDTGYDIHADIKYLTQSAVYAAALYSSDGKLLDVQTTPVASGATSADVAFTKQTGAAYVKVFLWDNLKSMQPLTESERINL